MSDEYRVCWRREHDRRLRTRLYQTRSGAQDFAKFIATPPTDDYLEPFAFDHLVSLGEASEVWIESRSVSDWSIAEQVVKLP